MPNAPLFSQRSPLPVSANLVLMNKLDLWEGGLGDGLLVEMYLLNTLPLYVSESAYHYVIVKNARP
jgi:hypothetical protein